MTARMARLEDYLAEKVIGLDLSVVASSEEVYQTASTLFGYPFMDDFFDGAITPENFSKDSSYKSRLVKFLLEKEGDKNKELLKIKAYLSEKNMIHEKDDWSTIIDKLVDEKTFLGIVLKKAEGMYVF